MNHQAKAKAIVLRDASRESEVVRALAARSAEVVDLDSGDAISSAAGDGLVALTGFLGELAELAADQRVETIYIPLRLGPATHLLPRAYEWQQTAEGLLRHGLGLDLVRIEMPVIELTPERLEELAGQLGLARRELDAA